MLRPTRRLRLARSLLSAGAALVVVATSVAATGSAAQAAPGGSASDKIRPELAEQLEAKSESDFWIRFAPKADLSKASAIKDWNERGTAVATALQKTAEESQEKVRAELDAAGLKYQSFWATNAIKVSGASTGMAQSIAAHSEVEGLYAPVVYELPELTAGTDQKTVNAVEWGVANIKADAVWAQYGVKGAGITIASIDSGVQFDHPALVNSYRGNNGDGTFNHNYNWFNAAGTCAAAPCDTDGHGTHTMGTMAGLDGANQIGVAPEVKWIAANGCCPNDNALITSGQWMLQPRDSNGQNPDVSKRPNIINNSWGSRNPSTDPFMEDVSLAWEASGIFGVWANGNSGTLGCRSSGSPGSRIANYSVGAYDVNNNVASFSGRGAGQDDEIKPNIAAPGVNVRSSIPGNGYGSSNGTSMAAPHLAGTIALLWSAAPSLVGEVTATRQLLNDTATDKLDAQCGGTADDNNVYGEGRLDALALLNAAPTGDNGTLAGKVTDAATGGPLAGVDITLTGPADRQLKTAADGTFSSLVPAGEYQAVVSLFGYGSKTVSATVTAGQTTTLNVALDASPKVTVSGAVTDGSGHGWPLYAKVSVAGPSGAADYTNPTNGRYSLSLPAGATYTLTYVPQYPGYQTVTKEVVVGSRNVVTNVEVPVSIQSCTTAPGYEYGSDGEYETFDGTTAPAGWTVVDHQGNGQVWKFTDDGNRGNLTGGTGGFAIIDSDDYGGGNTQNTSLVSPVVDLTAVTAPVIRFNQDFRFLGTNKADVDLSLDGGATWTNLLRQTANARGPQVKEIPIPQAAGQAQVQVRFHYYDAAFDWWWEVDNVLIGSQVTCVPTNGGLVVGHVRDQNDNGYVNGATVTSVDRPAEKATTAATPDDSGLPDGFFWLFSSLTGEHKFTASAGSYVSQTNVVDVEADWTTSTSFALAAGKLSVQPAAVTGKARMPSGKVTKTFTVTNTGGAPVDVTFGERDGGFELLRADGSRMTRAQILASDGAPEQRLDVPTSFAAKASMGASSVGAAANGPQAAPWTDITDYPAAVMDNRVVTLDGKIYSIGGGNGSASTTKNFVYDPAAQTWSAIADLPGARNAMTVGVAGGKIIATGGWGAAGPDSTTWSYDPATNAWTEKADNPAPRSAAGQGVVDGKLYAVGGCTTAGCTPMSNSAVRYDPVTDAWETLPAYPLSVAFVSCGGVDGVLYCTGGVNASSVGQKASFAFDPGAGSWTPIADAPADNWASSYAVANGKLLVVGGSQAGAISNAGFAYDPAANAWSALPNANVPRYRGGAACGFYKIGGSSGQFNATPDSEALPGFEECAAAGADVSWFSIDKTEATLAPGEQVTVTVTMTANVDQPGTYSGSVAIGENTPYAVPAVPVTFEVQPPTTWGKLLGTVAGAGCNGSAPIAGATVQVDSWAMSFTFTTDAQGKYAYWLDRRNNPLTMIVAKDGWKPQTRQTKVNASTPTVEDFTLSPVKC